MALHPTFQWGRSEKSEMFSMLLYEAVIFASVRLVWVEWRLTSAKISKFKIDPVITNAD